MALRSFREDPRRARVEAASAPRPVAKPKIKAEPKVDHVFATESKFKPAKKVEKTDVI